MRARILATLAVTFAATGILTEAASAGTLDVAASIAGAGTVTESGQLGFFTPPCGQLPPVSDQQVRTCEPWSYPGGGTVVLVAAPMPGSQFARWTGCDVARNNACELTVPAGTVTRAAQPRAHFTDVTAPVVTALGIVARDGALVADWKANKPVTYTCSVDGAIAEPCAPPYALRLPEGVHHLEVRGRDANGSSSDIEFRPRFVDTVLDEAPADGAHVATTRFVARTGAGTEIECSLDGGAYARCGGAGGPLTLPALTDGEHTLRVRARAGTDVDPSPVTRTWTVDTKAPDTMLPDVPGGFTLASDEADVSYRCALDGAAVACTALLLPGDHVFEAVAVDRAGNADASAARRTWSAPAVAAVRSALDVKYTYRGGRFTTLVVTGVPAGTKLTVTVKLPRKRAVTTTLARLAGKRLPNGTTITLRAGADTRTIAIRNGRAITKPGKA